MSDVSPIRASAQVAPAASAPGRHARGTPIASIRRAGDHVEVSALATYLSKLKQLPPIRTELVERVKAEIEAGTYETQEKIEAVIEELGEELA